MKLLLLLGFALVQVMPTGLAYRVNTILASPGRRKVASSSPGACSTTKDPGTCKGQDEAWYYDVLDDQCYFFLYSGCGGNSNRFPTLEACKRSCVREVKCRSLSCPKGCVATRKLGECPRCNCKKDAASKICRQGHRRGHCRALYHKWAYSPKERRCVQFVYGGCGGNENNFESKEECELVCRAV